MSSADQSSTSQNRRAMKVGTVVVVFIAAAEMGLRVYNPFPFRVRGDSIVLPAHQTYTISHSGATKLEPVTRVTKNSLGFRGPEPPRAWSRWLTMLVIGGSTTECLFLSDGKTWTDELARRAAAVRCVDQQRGTVVRPSRAPYTWPSD